MKKIKVRVEFNKGKRGVFLEKLETIVSETRKFLQSLGGDVSLPDPDAKWLGLDFRNGSLSYTAEYPVSVPVVQADKFNDGFAGLLKGERKPFVSRGTAVQFCQISKPLEDKEMMRFGIYPNGSGRASYKEFSKEIAASVDRQRAEIATYIGGAQGIIHSLFKEAERPYFQLRELSSGSLIKCFYPDEKYTDIANALRSRTGVVHVHGDVKADLAKREIESIDVDDIRAVDAYGYDDVQRFLHPEQVQ